MLSSKHIFDDFRFHACMHVSIGIYVTKSVLYQMKKKKKKMKYHRQRNHFASLFIFFLLLFIFFSTIAIKIYTNFIHNIHVYMYTFFFIIIHCKHNIK